MNRSRFFCSLVAVAGLVFGVRLRAADTDPVEFTVRLETILKHDDRHFLWFHPRCAAIPSAGKDGGPAVLLTLQKHLAVSDHYSGLSVMRTDDLGKTWTGPDPRPELDWRDESKDVTVAVADVTPGWHAQTKKYLAIGTKVRYSKKGEQLLERPRSNEAAFAIFDPQTKQWTAWQFLKLPDTETKFFLVCPGCVQWLVKPDGTVLLPVYYKGPTGIDYRTTVLHCAFDGTTLTYLEHGTEMALKVERGLCEPSIAYFKGKYYLTIRNDQKGYVTVGDDGLHFRPIEPWTFEDGGELGSYNTQQHWLTHSDGLFLVYTRRGANNDHVFRHRAPLFIARVDPEKRKVLRKTERVLMPERGATLGNFGAAAITEKESWVTDSEGVWNDDIRKRGAQGATFLARVIWSKPNRLGGPPKE
jgi:hypothetical protein